MELFKPHLPCDSKTLRKVYLRLALQYHPDKRREVCPSEATELFQTISAAYESLLETGGQAEIRRVKSPLAAAAELGDLDELRRLLNEDLSLVDAPDDVGITPLMFAAAGGCVDAAKLLVLRGADVNARNPINWSVILYGALGNHAEMVQCLAEMGAKVCPHALILTAYTGNDRSLQVMLTLADATSVRTESGRTLLHLACEGLCFLKNRSEQHANCVRLLIQHGIPLDARDPEGRTCLHAFVADRRWRTQNFEHSAPHMAILEELCLAGANVSAEDLSGESPMEMATSAGLSRVRETLLAFA